MLDSVDSWNSNSNKKDNERKDTKLDNKNDGLNDLEDIDFGLDSER